MTTNQSGFSRREMLAASALALGSMAVAHASGGLIQPSAPVPAPAARKRALRVAHMTDMHIQPELAADQGVAACLKHLHGQKDMPQLILTGGDHIMDGFASDEARTKLQWELWGKTSKNDTSIPMLSALGNHDIWGWNKSKSKTDGKEKEWGKHWACDQFGREKPYTSVSKAGWHFVALDSVRVDKDDPNGYEAFLDDEQFDWLEKDLKENAASPTLVLSHVPILSVTVFNGMKRDATGDLKVAGGRMHTDCQKLVALFQKHPQVKACISGHIHLLDRVEYNGVQYLCNGAVSGNWWKGKHGNCEPGYALLDLFDDGTLTNEYVPYGWVAHT